MFDIDITNTYLTTSYVRWKYQVFKLQLKRLEWKAVNKYFSDVIRKFLFGHDLMWIQI